MTKKSIHMAREFDVVYTNVNIEFEGIKTTIFTISRQEGVATPLPDKLYIHSDSYSIFEPRGWDLCKTHNRGICRFIEDDGQEVYEIILRDGKHFFTPKEEENE